MFAPEYTHQVQVQRQLPYTDQGIAFECAGAGNAYIVYIEAEIGKRTENAQSKLPEVYPGIQLLIGLVFGQLYQLILKQERSRYKQYDTQQEKNTASEQDFEQETLFFTWFRCIGHKLKIRLEYQFPEDTNTGLIFANNVFLNGSLHMQPATFVPGMPASAILCIFAARFMSRKDMQNIPVFELPGNRQFSFFRVTSAHKKHQYQPHRHNFYEVIFYRHAGGYQLVDFEELKVEPDTWTFLSPGQVHQFMTEHMEGVILTFSSDFLVRSSEDRSFAKNNLLFHHPEYHSSFSIRGEDALVMQSLLDLMEKEYLRSDRSDEILYTYLRLLLEMADRAFRSVQMPVSARNPRLLDRTRQIIGLVEKTFTGTIGFVSMPMPCILPRKEPMKLPAKGWV